MSSRTAGEAVATIGLAAILLVALAVRDDFAVPPPPPAPPFLLDVDGASIGSEQDERGTFWTIDGTSASITVLNTGDRSASPTVRMVLVDGPCAAGRSVVLSGGVMPRTVRIPAGGSREVAVEALTIASFDEVVIDLETSTDACQPMGGDPRAIAFQIYGLGADE